MVTMDNDGLKSVKLEEFAVDVSVFNGLSLSDVDVYVECDLCCGLFPQTIINQHITFAHDDELNHNKSTQRRFFAVTLLPGCCKQEFEDCVNDQESATEMVIDKDTASKQSSDSDSDQTLQLKQKARREKRLKERGAPKLKKDGTPRKQINSYPKTRKKVPFKERSRYADRMPSFMKSGPCKLSLDAFDDVPSGYDTKLLGVEPSTTSDAADVHTLLLMTDISDREQIKDWVDQLQRHTKHTYHCVTSKPNKNKSTRHYSQYWCRYADVAAIRDRVSLDALCLHFGIQDPSCEQKGVRKEVVQQFGSYFAQQMKPCTALKCYTTMIQQNADFTPEMMNDKSVMPTLSQVVTMHKNYHNAKNRGASQTYDPKLEDESRVLSR